MAGKRDRRYSTRAMQSVVECRFETRNLSLSEESVEFVQRESAAWRICQKQNRARKHILLGRKLRAEPKTCRGTSPDVLSEPDLISLCQVPIDWAIHKYARLAFCGPTVGEMR